MSEQEGYEAGLKAWQDCLPLVLARIPEDNDENATAFVSGFLEATLQAMLVAHDYAHVADMVRVALGNALDAQEQNPLHPADWRQQ